MAGGRGKIDFEKNQRILDLRAEGLSYSEIQKYFLDNFGIFQTTQNFQWLAKTEAERRLKNLKNP